MTGSFPSAVLADPFPFPPGQQSRADRGAHRNCILDARREPAPLARNMTPAGGERPALRGPALGRAGTGQQTLIDEIIETRYNLVDMCAKFH